MSKRLEGKIALITGASRGIGKAIALRYAEAGAHVFLAATKADLLESVAGEIRAQYAVRTAWKTVDVSDRASVEALVSAATAEFGQIDILVNNAGIYKPAKFVDYTLEDFDSMIRVNLYGVFHMTQAVLPGMMARKSGKIVNIASTAGKWGSRNQSGYNASKHAVVGLTRCLGLELAPFNIQVNAICPWLVETDMIPYALKEHAAINNVPESAVEAAFFASVPIKRLIKVDEVAHLAVYLGSSEADYINCQCWTVDGGYTMI